MADVLVIENNKKLADLFASDLMLAGFRVKTAVGYHEGVRLLDASTYQVIVLNPFFRDGLADDMFEKLTRDNLLHRVLVCSADAERVKGCNEKGIHAVMKPVRLMKLGQLITQIARVSEKRIGGLT